MIRVTIETLFIQHLLMTQDTKTISELNLNDEHITVGVEDSLREGAKRLLSVPGGILIVLDHDSKVKGVMGYKQFLQAIDKEMDMSSSKCGDIMEMDFMEVKNSDSIKEVLKQIRKRSPQAVVAVDENREFSGYFSPSDYKESRAIVKSLKSLKL